MKMLLEQIKWYSSGIRTRNSDCAEGGAETTQEDDFKGVGLEFADDMQATIVCAILVKKARDAGLDLKEEAYSWEEKQSAAVNLLNESELELLTNLKDGVVRTRSGALDIDDLGCLRADCLIGLRGNGHAEVRAFGQVFLSSRPNRAIMS